jgi:NitT/TauT family transport system ATP-binding protein
MSRQITVDELSMVYQGRGEPVIALQNINLDLEQGKFGSIIGPSGCGKSTLLRLVADILKPTAGSIRVGDASPQEARKQHAFGFVFQSPTLLPWRNVIDNVELPLDIVGRESGRRSSRLATDLLDLVGLRNFEKSYPFELSGGMQQRAAIARALILRPSVLLLDEPFGALDEITRQRMNLELLRIWAESGTTALLVTHSITEAIFMSDEVYIMSARPGRIVETIQIPLARPRTLDMMRSPVFFECANRVRDALFGETPDKPQAGQAEGY